MDWMANQHSGVSSVPVEKPNGIKVQCFSTLYSIPNDFYSYAKYLLASRPCASMFHFKKIKKQNNNKYTHTFHLPSEEETSRK